MVSRGTSISAPATSTTTTPAIPTLFAVCVKRRKTAESWERKESYDEGLAKHIGPESCMVAGIGRREALTGGACFRVGRMSALPAPQPLPLPPRSLQCAGLLRGLRGRNGRCEGSVAARQAQKRPRQGHGLPRRRVAFTHTVATRLQAINSVHDARVITWPTGGRIRWPSGLLAIGPPPLAGEKRSNLRRRS